MFSLTRREGAIGAALFAAVVVVALGGSALAGHLSTGVESYTGCLSQNGDLIKFKAGDEPLKPCSGNQVQVHLSGGDLTSITGGAGLSGGAESGAATLQLDPAYALPQGCAVGQEARWNGSAWVCWNDGDPFVAPLP